MATALASNGGAIDFTGTLTVGDTYDILVAYQKTGGGTGITDYHFVANDAHLSTSTSFSGASVGEPDGRGADASRKLPTRQQRRRPLQRRLRRQNGASGASRRSTKEKPTGGGLRLPAFASREGQTGC